MGPHLIFLFLFQSGLAFAFSYFIARIMIGNNEGESRLKMLRGIRKIQWIAAALALFMAPAMFFAYLKSLPDGQPVSLAVWPAVWILMILLAVIVALGMASRKKPGNA